MSTNTLARMPWEQIQFIFDSVFEGLIITDAAGIVRLLNTTARRLHQGMEIPLVSMPLADFSPHDWLETRRVLASGQAQLGHKLVLADTEVLVNRLPLIHQGEIIGVITTMQDIGVFDNIVEQLSGYRALHDELEAVLEQFGDAFVALDAHSRVLRVNTAYERLAAMGRRTLIGRDIHHVKRDPARIASAAQTVLEQQKRVVCQVRQVDGNDLAVTACPAFTNSGEIRMVLIRIQPLTQLVSLNKHILPHFETDNDSPIPDENDQEIQKICREAGIIANSSAMLRLVRQALKVSTTESSVLLQGESGVGKSLLATLIHANSSRKQHPLVVINCGAIPEEIMESELFGYVKGAFTGASPHGKVGLLEAANHGTIFFDEIGEMKYSMQVKLLEVIEKKSFIRVGCTKRISVDIRIIAATNRNLEEDVEHGLFRKDLYYRLNVIPLRIPPLRERREDIKALAQEILQRYNTRHKTDKHLSPALSEWFLQHDFSGNVRELVNIMEWMLVMGDGDELNVFDLPASLQNEALESWGSAPQPDAPKYTEASPKQTHQTDLEALLPRRVLPLKEAMRLMERLYLEQTLLKYDNIKDASDALEVHFSTLWRKMIQYNIDNNKKMRNIK